MMIIFYLKEVDIKKIVIPAATINPAIIALPDSFFIYIGMMKGRQKISVGITGSGRQLTINNNGLSIIRYLFRSQANHLKVDSRKSLVPIRR